MIANSERVFVDTSYAIALVVPADQHHRAARNLSDLLQKSNCRLITTRAVLLEIGNALTKRARQAAVELLSAAECDAAMEIVALTDELFQRGLELYSRRMDKTWSLVDCISFVVMADFEVTEAATADEHFEQAGFKPLLREPPQG